MSAPAASVVASLLCVLVACGRRAPEPAMPMPVAQPRPARGMPLRLPAAEVARMLEREPFELRSMKRTEGGVTRAYRAQAYFSRRGVDLPIKWKVTPSGGEGWNNVPRKEVAAFVIQQWFLDPDEWVVPPTAIRCVPLEEHREVWDVEPIVDETECVLGLAAAWLDGVKEPDAIFDPARFRQDAVYARHRANMNLVAYLIHHRDGRVNNFLVPKSDDGRVFLVDNGISFGGLVWNYFRPNWNVIRVPALRREAVDRLRRVTATDVSALLVLAQLEADSRGVLQATAREAPWELADGSRFRPGQAQFGLTEEETAGLAARVQHVLTRVDAGEIALF